MDKRAPWIITLLLVATFITPQAFAATSIKVIASFSVIEDLVKRVAGDDISITTIVPVGDDVHRWELTPPNVLAVEEADIVFYNGHGLEPWIRHVEAMANDTLTLMALAESANYAPLTIPVGQHKGNPDPHMWMDPKGAAAYIEGNHSHPKRTLSRQSSRFSGSSGASQGGACPTRPADKRAPGGDSANQSYTHYQ